MADLQRRWTPSRYRVVSDEVFRARSGQCVNVVYATRTGRLMALPEHVVRALAAGGDLDPRYLSVLREAELVVNADEDEYEILTRRSESAFAATGKREFVLLPTAYCNMGCEYCGQAHSRTPLRKEHRSVVAARVTAAMESSDVDAVTVRWFGGEPMAGYPAIRQLSRSFVADAARNDVAYDAIIVTNGSMLTVEKMVDLHVNCNVTKMEITIDGAADVHDRHRPLKSGGGSFEKIVTTLREALAHPDLASISLGLRTNVDRRNAGHIDDYIDTMAARGFADPRVRYRFAAVHPWFNDVSALELEGTRFGVLEAAWMRRLLRHGMHFDILPHRPMRNLCPATSRSSEVVSPTGTLFSCTEEPLVPALEATGGLGKVTDLGIPELRPAGPYDDWASERASYPCGECVLLGVCGGYCPKSWMQGHPACPSLKFNIQERMNLAAELAGLTPA